MISNILSSITITDAKTIPAYAFSNIKVSNITIGGKHVDDIIINFNLLDENDENMENNFFIYNSVDDQVSWEIDTYLGHKLSWDDLNPNLEQIIKTADILISAVGKNIIEGKMLKSDCVVVDVGIFKDENGKTRGDVDFESASQIASYISPVPGGVGPMTIASLMLNTVELFEKQQ